MGVMLLKADIVLENVAIEIPSQGITHEFAV